MKILSFKINKKSSQPIYKQIISAVYSAIEKGEMKEGDLLPSVNEIAKEFGLSRDSVFKAYNELRSSGIINSVAGKGYYIYSMNVRQKEKIFFLLDEYSEYKKELFERFKKTIGSSAAVDLFFHNYNITVMEKLINEAIGKYTKYVIWPVMTPKVKTLLKKIPSRKLFIVDAGIEWYFDFYPGVYQSYAEDILTLFKSNIYLFNKYSRIFLVYPKRLLLFEIQRGFKQFIKDEDVKGEIISDLKNISISKGDSFFVIDDDDLVKLVHEGESKNLKLGKDYGIIAYNETPLKSIAAGGITILSTDFGEMGHLLAEMIKNKKKKSIKNPSRFFIRKSF
jgi:DNA-binding transcriptional regulator YhcF (GntR family)